MTTATTWSGPVPRASDHAVAAFGRGCLKLFLAAQFLSLTRLFFVDILGDGVTPVASQAGVVSVALLVPAVLVYGLRSGSIFGNLIPAAQHWVVMVTGVGLLLFAYGWLGKGYNVNPCIHDLAAYVVVVACTILGSQRAVWEDTNRFLLALFAAAL
ncbi:MAG TPA: hypothetical protein VIC87_10150, partial [Vicinamibacteria bacterium]